MTRQVQTPDLAALRRHWRRWTVFVERHARRRRGGQVVDPHEYERVHHNLVTACRALAAAADGTKAAAPSPEFYRGLEELARPWLTARVLEQADREILVDLLARCRLAEQTLESHPRFRAVGRLAGPAVAVVGVVAVLLLVFWSAPRIWIPVWDLVRSRWHIFLLSVLGTTEAPWWFFPCIAAVLIAIIVVWRSARTIDRW